MNYTYIVRCCDGSFYTGWTTDLDRRIKVHNEGKGARYTRSRLPVELVYYESYETSREAMKREYAIKRMTRKDKLELILNDGNLVSHGCRACLGEKADSKVHTDT